jgi:hypothetical protein
MRNVNGSAPLPRDQALTRLASELDIAIRQGKSLLVRKKLLQLDRSKISRPYRARYANLFRRSGLPEISLRLLNRIVRSPTSAVNDATPEEKTDYAASLIAIGASSEGLQLLREFPSHDHPDALLQMAIGYVTRWEYLQAIPVLLDLLRHPNCSEYQNIVGRINLASALVIENQLKEAEDLLLGLHRELVGRPEFALVLGNTYELLAQIATAQKDHTLARTLIAEGTKLQAMHTGITSLLLEKTQAINNALDPLYRSLGIRQLQSVLSNAQKYKRWETCREAHLYLSRVLNDQASFMKVYFGTPFPNYRRRMLREFPQENALPNEYVCLAQGAFQSYPLVFDTLSGELEGSSSHLAFASLPHKLLCLLAGDFFRPYRVSKMFAELYPDEYFDPYSSPDRVHKAIIRLRQELQEQNIPLVVLRERGGEGYTLSPSGSVALRVYKESLVCSRSEMYFAKLSRTWGAERHAELTKAQIEQRLHLSTRSVSRILRWAKDKQLVSARRQSKGQVYKLTS